MPQCKLDFILVWKLDCWGCSLVDLMTTLHDLTALGVGFVLLTEALDLTTPAGRAFADVLAVFAEFEWDVIRERIKAGMADARKRGKAHGRPCATANDAVQIRALAQQGLASSGAGAAYRPVEAIRAAGVGASGGDVRGGSAAQRCMGMRSARDV